MERRAYLAALGSGGLVAAAGCTGGPTSLTAQPGNTDGPPQRGSLEFVANGSEIASFGVDGTVGADVIDLRTEFWHREETTVRSIELRLWTPDSDGTTQVAVQSPVEGDSSPPPKLSLYTPDRSPGTVVEVTDLDDLADETISTLNFLVRPIYAGPTTLAVDATIDLVGGGWLGDAYDLSGELTLEFPALDSA